MYIQNEHMSKVYLTHSLMKKLIEFKKEFEEETHIHKYANGNFEMKMLKRKLVNIL